MIEERFAFFSAYEFCFPGAAGRSLWETEFAWTKWAFDPARIFLCSYEPGIGGS